MQKSEKASAVLKAEANASQMTIDAEVRATQMQIDAEAARIEKITEVERKRILILNEAIESSSLDESSLSYLDIQAFKDVVKSQTNTIILQSNMTELGNFPFVKQLWDQSKPS